MIRFNTFFQFYIFSFIAFYFATYPLRVYTQNQKLSIMPLMIGVLTPLLIFLYVNTARNRTYSIFIDKKAIFPLNLILSILLLYSINIVFYYPSPMLYATFIKYIIYSSLLIVFLMMKNNIQIFSFKKIQWLITILSVITFVAVIYNSFFWRIPQGVELLPKYFIGPFIRAGGGYLDPNFLSINIIVLIFLSLTYIENRLVKAISLIMLFIAYFLTFSRGAMIFGTIILLMYLFNKNKKAWQWSLTFLFLVFLITYITLEYFDLTFLFDRFYNEEGQSSTEDRLFQYRSFLYVLENSFSLKNLFFGFGGLDYFVANFGVALHSFWLNLILDIGLLAPFIIIVLWIYFFKNTKNYFSKYLLVFWFLQESFLPNLPDTLYLIFILSLLNTSTKESV